MPISNKGLALVNEFEGCVLLAYPDPYSPLGKECTRLGLKLWEYKQVPRWQLLKPDPVTIGHGHTGASIKLGDKWDQETADSVQRLDLKVAEYRLSGIEGLNQNQTDALISLAYNCPKAFGDTSLRKYLLSKEWDRAADEILKWHYAGGKPSQGLMRRRAAERDLFMTPAEPPASSPAA